eukprot:403341782
MKHTHTLFWLTGTGQDAKPYEKLIDSGRFRVPQGVRIVLMWPVFIEFPVPYQGVKGLRAWYDFDLNKYTMNRKDALQSADYVMQVIQNELTLIDNDYKRLFLCGFSGGGIINYYIYFRLLKKQIGLMYCMACFPPDNLVFEIEQLAKEDQQFKKDLVSMRQTPMYFWYGEHDEFFVGKPSEELQHRLRDTSGMQNNYHIIVEKGINHRVSMKGLEYLYQLMQAIVDNKYSQKSQEFHPKL